MLIMKRTIVTTLALIVAATSVSAGSGIKTSTADKYFATAPAHQSCDLVPLKKTSGHHYTLAGSCKAGFEFTVGFGEAAYKQVWVVSKITGVRTDQLFGITNINGVITIDNNHEITKAYAAKKGWAVRPDGENVATILQRRY